MRDPWFDLVHGAVDASLQSRGPLRGALFWQWDGESGPRPDAGSNIRDSDSTFTHKIAPFAHKLAEQPPTRVPGCTPRGGAASLAAPAPVPAPAGGAPSSTQGPQQASAPQSAGRRLLSAKRA